MGGARRTLGPAVLGAALVLGAASCLQGCPRAADRGAAAADRAASEHAGGGAPTFNIPDRDLPEPLILIAYGDTRFTSPAETAASQPAVRRALVARIAAEHPAAIFLNGDLPWHGVEGDYAAFRDETSIWRRDGLRLYPALGNHEFSHCSQADCLELWWGAFPELRGLRWYSVALGSRVLAIALDTDASLQPGSEQQLWLTQQLAALPPTVRFVLLVMHHPPVADPQSGDLADHNPRDNETVLAAQLAAAAQGSRARFLVSAGHIHNYERFLKDGVVYLVSGGGGAKPYPVVRGPDDLYAGRDFPNYHYVRLTIRGNMLTGDMFRLQDHSAPDPGQWEPADHFELSPAP